MLSQGENDFERRVRESEQALLRSVPVGQRPFFETWGWWFFFTCQFWLRLLWWPFQDDHTTVEDVLAGLSLVIVLLSIPF